MTAKPERLFPLQIDHRRYTKRPMFRFIPWSVAEKAHVVYAQRYGTDQSLAQLAARGGFGHGEMDTYHPTWREEVDELAKLRAQITAWRAVVLDFLSSHTDCAGPGECVCDPAWAMAGLQWGDVEAARRLLRHLS